MNIPSNLPILNQSEKEKYWQVLDSTKLQTYASCPRQYFFEYVLGWRLDRQSNHLVFGQAWHAALEYLYNKGMNLSNVPDAFDKFIQVYRKEWPEQTDSWFGGKTPEAALQALVEYVKEYATDLYDYKVLATEVTDYLPLNESDNIVVKLDAVMQNVRTGQITIMEHKTGSSSGMFWAKQWHLSIQVGAYIAACNHFYKQEATPAIIDGVFFLKTKRTFQRELVIKNSDAMANWANTVLSIMRDIENNFSILKYDDIRNDVQYSFRQNTVACDKFSGCQFYDLCTGIGNPLAWAQDGQPPIGFKEEWWNPLSNS